MAKLTILLTLFLAGCSVPAPRIYHQAGAEVRVYPTQAALMAALPPVLRAIGGIARVHGWYDKGKGIIHAIDMSGVVEHELRHHTEPGWTHPVSCVRLPCEDAR